MASNELKSEIPFSPSPKKKKTCTTPKVEKEEEDLMEFQVLFYFSPSPLLPRCCCHDLSLAHREFSSFFFYFFIPGKRGVCVYSVCVRPPPNQPRMRIFCRAHNTKNVTSTHTSKKKKSFSRSHANFYRRIRKPTL